jgi:hypothetical protein
MLAFLVAKEAEPLVNKDINQYLLKGTIQRLTPQVTVCRLLIFVYFDKIRNCGYR